MSKLSEIQKTLKAPKSQYNTFGKYKYRNCEDILEAVKPLLNGTTLTISDKIVAVGDRIYVEATATLAEGDFVHTVTAYAREADQKKGMDEAQVTGAASSYARKYALNGLFLIDDTKDADHNNTGDEPTKPPKTASTIAAISAAQHKMIEAEINSRGVDRDKFKLFFGLKHLTDMPARTFNEALEMVRQKPLKEAI
jgi:hypothetical protein